MIKFYFNYSLQKNWKQDAWSDMLGLIIIKNVKLDLKHKNTSKKNNFLLIM